MQEPSRWISMWPTLVGQAPTLLVLLAGFVVALAMTTRCRGPATVAAIGISVQLLAFFLSLVVQAWVIGGTVGDVHSAGMIKGASFFLISLVRAAGLGAVIGAVFMGRWPSETGIGPRID